MEPYFKWSKDLELGVRALDSQHKYLVHLLNHAHEISQRKYTLEELVDILRELIDYTYDHFDYEEVFMMVKKYEYIVEHQAQHEIFRKKIREFIGKITIEGQTNFLQEVVDFIAHWIKTHIKHVDSQLKDVINERK
jgi:hemerythrin-like metal-binding protein